MSRCSTFREERLGDRLSNRTVATLPPSIARPAYDRAAVTPGIVHLGVGAFHRAHQAAYVDDCLAAGETEWGIVGASLQSASTADALLPQDGLYTLAERGSSGEALRVIGSILSVLVAPQDPAALLDALTDPAHPHRHADDHRKGLSAQRGRRSRCVASGYRRRPGHARKAADRAWFPGRGAGAPPRCRNAALHDPVLRQPSGQWRDAAPPARPVRSLARCRACPPRRRGRGLPVEHGRPHRAGDDRRRPRQGFGGARRRGCLAGDDRAVPAMGHRGQFSRRAAGLGKVRRHHGARREAVRGDEAAPAQRRAFLDRLSRAAQRP